MKLPRFTLAALALVMLAPGCTSLPLTPIEMANRTTADEQAATSAELLYKTASRLGEILARAKLIDPAKYRDYDAKAFTALVGCREAYRSGNSDDFAAAFMALKTAVAEINRLAEAHRNEP